MSFSAYETLQAIKAVEVITGHPRVALKLIEISRDPDLEVENYAQLIETDVSLSARLLGLLSSARHPREEGILTVKTALRTLGLRQVRVIVMSHCVASLHQSLAGNGEDTRSLWSAAMTKAIASRKVAEFLNLPDLDAAYLGGLLQDLGVAMMHSLDRTAMTEILNQIDSNARKTLSAEVEHFGLDHQSVGSSVARRIDLPEFYCQAIENHHSVVDRIIKSANGIDLALQVASLLPHDSRNWTNPDMGLLATIVEERLPRWTDMEEFIQEVQAELSGVEALLAVNTASTPGLIEALIYASQENARESQRTVANNIWLREDSTTLNERLGHAKRAHKEAESRADRDPLTKLFNRSGWDRRVRATLSQVGNAESTLGVAFFDLDHFKELNDELGHSAGDQFLQEVSQRMVDSVRDEDLICRWGGDEFVILFCGASTTECLDAARRVKQHVQATPIVFGGRAVPVSVTAGFVSVDTTDSQLNLAELLQIADQQLYKAKSVQRGTLSSTRVSRPA